MLWADPENMQAQGCISSSQAYRHSVLDITSINLFTASAVAEEEEELGYERLRREKEREDKKILFPPPLFPSREKREEE